MHFASRWEISASSSCCSSSSMLHWEWSSLANWVSRTTDKTHTHTHTHTPWSASFRKKKKKRNPLITATVMTLSTFPPLNGLCQILPLFLFLPLRPLRSHIRGPVQTGGNDFCMITFISQQSISLSPAHFL